MTTKSIISSGPQGAVETVFTPTNEYLPLDKEGRRVIRLWTSANCVAGEWGSMAPGSEFQADEPPEFDNGLRYLGCKVGEKFYEGEWPNQEECEEPPCWAIALA